MIVYAIGDLHLPGGDDKPMAVFGAHWEGHWEKICQDWRARVTTQDVVLIPGDISWAMQLEHALDDLHAIAALPGRKITLKRLWPGVVVTTLMWLAAAGGFSIYLSFTPTYTVTYGTLAGVIITLMFFYLTGATIIYGAELNAALHRLAPQPRSERDTWPSD